MLLGREDDDDAKKYMGRSIDMNPHDDTSRRRRRRRKISNKTITRKKWREHPYLRKGIQSTLHVVVVIAVKALHKCLEDFRPVLAIALLHQGTDNNGNSRTHLLVRST